MRKPSIIAIDFDGVLADTNGLKAQLVKEQLGKLIPPGDLNRTAALSRLPVNEYNHISQLATNPARTEQTLPVEGSLEGIEQLRKQFEVKILTRRQNHHLRAAEAWVNRHAATNNLPVIGVNKEATKQDWCRRAGALVLADDDLAQVTGFEPGETLGILFAPQHHSSWITWGVKVARSWDELIEMSKSQRLPQPAPTSATVELGRRCNLNCTHCFSNSGPGADVGPATEQVRQTLEALAKLGVRTVWFSGGEPTLRQDLPELVTYAADLGLDVYLSSNGIMSSTRVMELAKAPLKRIDVSFDGIHDDHDALRGKGTFERAIAGLECLRKARVPVALSVHLRRRMKFSMAEMAMELLRLQTPMRFAPLLPFGRASQLRHLCPTVEEFLEWLMELREYIPSGMPLSGSDSCWAGESTVAVDSFGSLTPCCFQREIKLVAINSNHVSDHWRDSEILNSIRSNPPKGCTQCDIAKRFGQPE